MALLPLDRVAPGFVRRALFWFSQLQAPRDAQRVFAYRVDLFLAEEHPLLETKMVWTWAAQEEERPPTTAEIFEAYQTSRAETLVKLERMPLADWWRSGMHLEFGELTLRQQASYFAAHERTHLPQMARLRTP